MTAGDTRRIRLTIHYDGGAFHGWQLQPDVRTVQGVVETGLRRLTGEDATALASGRTDAGVHATGQVAAVSLPSRWTPDELRRALNAVLPDDIWIAGAGEADPDFHPRYDARARTYDYFLGTVPEAHSPFHRRWCWPIERSVDPGLLSTCAGRLSGRRSFGAFAKSGQPHRGEVCAVAAALWEPWESLGYRFRITADRFLHHMVRYLVGTMVDVASGRRPGEELGALLEGAEGVVTSPPAPPEGLFLVDVAYAAIGGAGAMAGAEEAAGREDGE